MPALQNSRGGVSVCGRRDFLSGNLEKSVRDVQFIVSRVLSQVWLGK